MGLHSTVPCDLLICLSGMCIVVSNVNHAFVVEWFFLPCARTWREKLEQAEIRKREETKELQVILIGHRSEEHTSELQSR